MAETRGAATEAAPPREDEQHHCAFILPFTWIDWSLLCGNYPTSSYNGDDTYTHSTAGASAVDCLGGSGGQDLICDPMILNDRQKHELCAEQDEEGEIRISSERYDSSMGCRASFKESILPPTASTYAEILSEILDAEEGGDSDNVAV